MPLVIHSVNFAFLLQPGLRQDTIFFFFGRGWDRSENNTPMSSSTPKRQCLQKPEAFPLCDILLNTFSQLILQTRSFVWIIKQGSLVDLFLTHCIQSHELPCLTVFVTSQHKGDIHNHVTVFSLLEMIFCFLFFCTTAVVKVLPEWFVIIITSPGFAMGHHCFLVLNVFRHYSEFK